MWTKFGNSSISMREVIITFYKDLTIKTNFFEGWSRFKFNNLGLVIGMTLKFYTNVAKGLKIKVRKLLGLFPTFEEVTGENRIGEPFYPPTPSPPPSWIGLRHLIGLIESSWTFWKRFCNIWNFVFLLAEDDSALSRCLYKKSVYEMDVKTQDCVSQTLEIDDKDSEQLSSFISQEKNTMHWLILRGGIHTRVATRNAISTFEGGWVF